ncbi:RHS repeat-associated core domain-containing protein [Arthrobacter sp. MDB2-24]
MKTPSSPPTKQTGQTFKTLSPGKELSFNLGDRLLSTWERVDSTLKRVRYHHPGLTGTRYVTEPEAGPLLGVAHEALPYGGALVHDAGISSPFTSYDRDTSTGLDYAVNRFYHPELGRFLQPDPLGAEGFTSDSSSMNLYAYCNDDPINRTDPLGLLWRVSCVQAGDGPMICTGTWTPDRGPILPGGRTIGGGGAGEGGGERGSGGGGGGGGEKSAPKSEPDQDARIEAFWKCAEPKLETMGIIATVGGAAIGALGGGIVGGIAGASLGTLAAPGPGTVGGAIVGVGKGVFEGAAAGLGVGALTGGAYALTSCPSPF